MRRAAWLAALLPVLAQAQSGQVGARREPAGLLLGRACLDLDGDGRCGPGEPGLAGARVRLADGRLIVTDEAGRFHWLGLAGRELFPGRAAYGAVQLRLEGTELRRLVELAPDGAVAVDLAAPVVPLLPRGIAVAPGPAGPPALRDGEVGWVVGGSLPAGSRAWVGGREAAVDEQGRFGGEVTLGPGRTVVAVVTALPEGTVAVDLVALLVVRPEGEAVRVYPEPVRRLAVLRIERGPSGALVHGQVEPGVVARLAGLRPEAGPGGAFAAFVAAPGDAVPLILEVEDDRLEALLPPGPPTRAFGGQLLGELELSFGDGGTRLAGRGAGVVEGRWRGLHLQAGVDLDDRDRGLSALGRPRDALTAAPAPDPPRRLATAGDGSLAEDGNAGRGRLWARAEVDGAALSLGWTRADLGDGLGRYDRALFGARVDGEGALGPLRLQAEAFGSASGEDAGGVGPPRALHEELRATGGSLFYLAGRAIVAGSVAVRVAWLDPLTGLDAAGRPLQRGADYELDEGSGRLLLARPLASVAGRPWLATGEPFAAPEARLVVDYLDAGGAGAARLAGGRAGVTLGPVGLEARGAAEDGVAEGWRVGAASLAIDLGTALSGRLEAARSSGRLFEAGTGYLRSSDGGFASVASPPAAAGADAVRAELHGEVAGVAWRGWWRERGAGYSDGDRLEARAARERGADLRGAAGPVGLQLGLAERVGTDERDPSGATPLDARRITARAVGQVGPIELTGEALHERLVAPVLGEQAGAGLKAAWRAPGGLGLELSHLQALAVSGAVPAATFTGAGASLAWRDGQLAARGGWGPELGPRLLLSGERREPGGDVYGVLGADPAAATQGRSSGSVLGARSHAGGLEVFTEEQVAEEPTGLRSGRLLGASAEPLPGLRLALHAERGERLLAGVATRRRDAVGAGAWLTRGPVRLSARGELIDEAGDLRGVASGAADWAAAPAFTVALHALVARGAVEGRRADDLDASLGGAWRGDQERTALATLGRVEQTRPGEAHREAWLLTLATTAEVAARLRGGLGALVAVQRIGGVEDDRLAGSARLEARLLGPLDAAVEYARRMALGRRVLGDLDALRAEVGVAVGPGRIAVGYTVLGFAGDGVDPSATARRAFLRATLGL